MAELCPLLNQECVEEQCAWWVEVYDVREKEYICSCAVKFAAEELQLLRGRGVRGET